MIASPSSKDNMGEPGLSISKMGTNLRCQVLLIFSMESKAGTWRKWSSPWSISPWKYARHSWNRPKQFSRKSSLPSISKIGIVQWRKIIQILSFHWLIPTVRHSASWCSFIQWRSAVHHFTRRPIELLEKWIPVTFSGSDRSIKPCRRSYSGQKLRRSLRTR